jgi:hypothetical protein
VRDALVVAVQECARELLHDVASLLLRVLFLLDDAIEELATAHLFHDHVEGLLAVEHLLELDDVGVVHELQHLDLNTQRLFILGRQTRLVDALDRPVRVVRLTYSALDRREAPAARLNEQCESDA